MFVVVEATLSALCGWQGPTTPAVHRHGVALQQMSMGHRIHQVRMSSKRKAKSAEAAGEVVVDEAIQNILDDERCNVCLTHVNADFDSLAGTGHQVSKLLAPPPSLPTEPSQSRSGALPQATCRLCPLADPMGWGGRAGGGRCRGGEE